LINNCVAEWQNVSTNIQADIILLRRCADAFYGKVLAKDKLSSQVVQQVIDLIQKRLNVDYNIINFGNGASIDDDELYDEFASTLDEDIYEPKRSYEIIKHQISQFEPKEWRKSRLAALEHRYKYLLINPQ
jgi:hypothetical protein